MNPDKGYNIGLEMESGQVKLMHESMLDMDRHFGPGLGLLKQEYTKITLLEETESRLGSCLFENQQNGDVHVEIEVDVMA